MSRPGTRLRALAGRLCNQPTMERIIDPAIGDLQEEYAQARRAGRVWRSRLALLVGYVAIAKVFVFSVLLATRQAWRDWDADDQRNLRRVLSYSAIVTTAFAFLVEMPVLQLPTTVDQSYREEIFGGPLRPGQNELTLSELQTSAGGAFSYHARLAVVAAPLTFAVFGVVAATRRWQRAAAIIIVCAAVISYVVLVNVGRHFSQEGLMPPRLAAWMPQFVLVYATILVASLVGRSRASVTRTLV